jgi:hypothetical protein
MPYRTPAASRITAGPWLDVHGSGGDIVQSPPAWDYNSTIVLGRQFDVDLPALLEDCGLPSSTPLDVCVRFHTSRARLRTLCSRTRLPAMNGVHASIPGTDLAGVLHVQTTIELTEDVPSTGPFVARRAGSVLWRDVVSVSLEGDAQLPIAPVDFSTQAHLPGQAAWHISLDGSDWHHAALGSLLVLLNTDNATVASALDGKLDDETATVLWDTLQVDVVTDLVGKALDDEDFPVDEDGAEEGPNGRSLAQLVSSLVRGYLCAPNETVPTALQRLRDLRTNDPSLYRASVQSGLAYLGRVTA